MSTNAAEFFSKGNIKKFKNGVKAAFERHAVKTLAATAVLAGAFAVCTKQSVPESDAVKPRTTYAVKENGDTLCAYQAIPMNDADYARLQKLVNAATKTESGCEILKGIAKAGTTLRIDYSGEDDLGYFLPEDNSICLGRQHGDADLQSILSHEGEHALQNQRVPQRTSRYNHAEKVDEVLGVSLLSHFFKNGGCRCFVSECLPIQRRQIRGNGRLCPEHAVHGLAEC